MGDAPGIEGLKAVADLAKQIITLDTAIIGVTVTFADKFQKTIGGKSVTIAPSQLGAAWIAYVLSVLFAVFTLMAVAGSMNEIDTTRAETNSNRLNTKLWGGLMLASFLIALAFTAAAGWQAIK
jgi:membrane-anchored glycerophosphoryl diester phosphodiesterase (GDPDase)